MLDHAREAIAFAHGRTRAELDTDRMLELALVRLIEITGEAAARVTSEFQAIHGQVPWPQIAAMRNRLVHGYDDIDHDVLWDTIHKDLPGLVDGLERILEAWDCSPNERAARTP
jgi:uncharacterized protein with HEPN domain